LIHLHTQTLNASFTVMPHTKKFRALFWRE